MIREKTHLYDVSNHEDDHGGKRAHGPSELEIPERAIGDGNLGGVIERNATHPIGAGWTMRLERKNPRHTATDVLCVDAK